MLIEEISETTDFLTTLSLPEKDVLEELIVQNVLEEHQRLEEERAQVGYQKEKKQLALAHVDVDDLSQISEIQQEIATLEDRIEALDQETTFIEGDL